FTIDSSGKAILLFPRLGSVENRLPIDGAPPEILLGGEGGFEIGPPYGIDTFFLLTTDEPLPNPWILEWDGVRGPRPEVHTALEELLLLTGSGESRSTTVVTPSTWSIERKVVESISP
ncbi:MAG TPA: hypothetical protein VF698_07490, partial [Thermoanaerobaculia bacterium]